MKKILLTTTAIVSLAASAASAEGVSVKFIGKVDGQMGFTSQKTKNINTNSIAGDDYNVGTAKKSKNNFRAITELGADVSGRVDSGVSYGAVILMEGENRTNTQNAAPYTTTSTIELKRGYVHTSYDSMGKIELGTNEGADETMKLGAQSIAAATGGVDGDYDNFVNKNGHLMGVVGSTTASTTRGTFLLAPSIYGTNDSKLKRSDKVTIYSPMANGFQAGVSYAPNFTAHGKSDISNSYLTSTSAMLTNSVRDVISGGISFQGQFDQVGVAASATGATGKAKKAYLGTSTVPSNQAYHDLKSYNLGAKLTFSNFALAGSYGDMGKSFLRKDVGSYANNVALYGINSLNNKKRSNYWTAGLGYTQGPVAASVTYFNADNFGNKTEVVSLGADYAVAPGFKPYAELSFYDLKSAKDLTNNNVVTKNSGNVVIVGAKLQF